MKGREGQIFDLADTEAYGMSVEASPIPFGRIVVQSEKYDNACRLPDADDLLGKTATPCDNSDVIGISIHEQDFRKCDMGLAYPVGISTDKHYKKETESLSIGTKGRYYVKTESDIKPQQKVFYRIKTDSADPLKSNLGSIRGDDDGGNCLQLKGAKFVLQTAPSGSCAVIEINMGAN